MSEQPATISVDPWTSPSWKTAARDYHQQRSRARMRASEVMADSDEIVGYLLAELRCATLRARTAAADLNAIGLALRGGLITPEQALGRIEEADALRFLAPLPDEPVVETDEAPPTSPEAMPA